jgi:hypothetical protein
MSDEQKTTSEIVIGGEKKVINKLKAGKFYDAQKTIGEIFAEVGNLSSSKTVDGKKTDIKDMELASLVQLFEGFPHKVAKFVSICSDIPEAELLEKAYPEEISEAFGICLELNNVMENIKNSVAPIGKLGLEKKAN